jgi:hypothetical protein
LRWLTGGRVGTVEIWLLNGCRELFEREPDLGLAGFVGRDFVVAAAQVLNKRMTGGQRLRRAEPLQSAHWPQPGFQSAVVSFDRIVRIPLGDVDARWQLLVKNPRISGRPVRRHLNRLDAAQAPERKKPSQQPCRDGRTA